MDSGPLSRRSALQLGGTALIGGLSGCSRISDSGGIEVAGIQIQSGLDEAHTVYVELERDDELVVQERVTVGADTEVATIPSTWPTDPATYKVTYAVVGPAIDLDINTRQFTSVDVPDESECVGVNIGLADYGDVKHLVGLRSARYLDQSITCS